MEQISESLFEYAFELVESTVDSLSLEQKDLIIVFSSINVHKYFGKIEFGIEQSFVSNAQMIIRDAVMVGDRPDFPANVLDCSVVNSGSIYGNYVEYPFAVSGDLQIVITFYNHEKLTIKSSKAFMIIKEVDSRKSNVDSVD